MSTTEMEVVADVHHAPKSDDQPANVTEDRENSPADEQKQPNGTAPPTSDGTDIETTNQIAHEHDTHSEPADEPPEQEQQEQQEQQPETQPDTSRATQMPVERNSQPLTFDTPALPVRSVVVFLDRAEVARTVRGDVREGENEVILKNLSPAIDRDSIRVEGSGHATITEVAFQIKTISSTDDDGNAHDPDSVRRLRSRLNELKKERVGVSDTLARVKQQRKVLNQFPDRIVEQAAGKHLAELVSDSALEGIERFFTMFEEQSVELDEYKMRTENKLNKLDIEIQRIKKDLEGMKAKPEDAVTELRELSILLDSKQSGEIELHVSYVVADASWSPKYDVRVESETRKMKIDYFGMIQQSTGEDWHDAKVALSTAMPSVGGQAPELTSKYLYLVNEHTASKKSPSKFKGATFFRAPSFRRKKKSKATAQVQEKEVESEEEGEALGTPETIAEGVTSTTYEITNPTNIPADNSAHKVCVASVNLHPDFEYEAVPKLAAHAFLKAKTKNDSPYAFLEGPANIFLDNNFVTTSSLSQVSPSEEFECFLGVDAAVRVTFTPLRRYQEQGGFVSKTRIITFNHQIEITNNRQDECKIKVTDQLPRSTEEKIKVRRSEPEIPKAEQGQQPNPRINAANNIEWMLSIPPSEKRELTVRYTIEYPRGATVEGLN